MDDIQKNIETLRAQMGGMQVLGLKNNVDIYKNSSPLDANTHITNIATSLAKDYGVTDLRDIEAKPGVIPRFATTVIQVRGQAPYTVNQYDVDSNGVVRWNKYATVSGHTPGEAVQANLLDYKYFNKNTKQEIPAYKFASTGEGDGYSDYTLQTIKLADGTNAVIPMQEYSKSGFGAVQENLAPILPIVALALTATGVGAAIGTSIMGTAASAAAAEAVGAAAISLGTQALAGKINNFSDVLQAVAPAAVTFGVSEFADMAKAADLAKQDLAYANVSPENLENIGKVTSTFTANTDAGKLFESITGVGGKVADVAAGSLQGATSAAVSDQDVTLGAIGGGAKGYFAKPPVGTGSTGPAPITTATPFQDEAGLDAFIRQQDVTNPFSNAFTLYATDLSSAPENVDALSKALGVDTNAVTSATVTPNISTSTISTDLADQTNQAFSTEAFMPGKTTTTTPTFATTTQEGMLGDVGSGVSNIMGNTTLGNVTDLGATNTYGGMLGEIGSGASNIMGNTSIGNVATLDVTGVNKGLGGTLGTSQLNETTSNILGNASSKPTISGENIVKIGTAVAGVAAAGAVTDAATNTTRSVSTIGRPTYANAPIKGFRMQKVQNAGGLTSYIPFINETSLLPVPQGYKQI
jgi:hypothetical protein